MFAEWQDGEIEIETPQAFLLEDVGEPSVKDVDDSVGVAGAGHRHVRCLDDVLLNTPEMLSDKKSLLFHILSL